MDSDWILMGIIIGCFLYLSGYPSFATALIMLLVLIFMVSVLFRKAPAVSGSGSNVLEPIVIESTRGPPYTIPGEMSILYVRKAKPRKKWESIQHKWGKGLGGLLK